MSEQSEDDRIEPATDLPETLEAAFTDVFRLIEVAQTDTSPDSAGEDRSAAAQPQDQARDHQEPDRPEEEWPAPPPLRPGITSPRHTPSRPAAAILRRRMMTALRSMDMVIEAALDDPWGPAPPAPESKRPVLYEGREF